MSTATKKMNIFRILFGSGIDVEEYDENVIKKLPSELKDTLGSIAKKEEKVKKGFNSGKGGVTPKINPNRLEAMREKHDEVAAKSKPQEKKVEYEIGD